MVPVPEAELQSPELLWQAGVEPEHVVAVLHSRVAALYEVDGAGHRAEVDPLGGRPALDVRQVTGQRTHEPARRFLRRLPRLLLPDRDLRSQVPA
jgi:hypothetical protein